ncbi:hypothetical protein X975_08469, partial [Stegodyphus mimosarum]
MQNINSGLLNMAEITTPKEGCFLGRLSHENFLIIMTHVGKIRKISHASSLYALRRIRIELPGFSSANHVVIEGRLVAK